MNKITILLQILLLVTPLYAEEPVSRIQEESPRTSPQDAQKRIRTSLGTVYVGMPAEKLYNIYQEKDRILIPHNILSSEWHVFRDWTSKSPYDTITFYINNGRVTGWKREYASAPFNKGSLYEYYQNENIEIWFFPKDQAKWHGAKVSLLDWHKLTRAQQVMFITEYVREINNQFHSDISVNVDRYILAMDYYADVSTRENRDVPAAGALNNILIADGKAREAPPDVA